MLVNEEKNEVFDNRSGLARKTVGNMHGPALQINQKLNATMNSSIQYHLLDQVLAVHSPYWPDEALEWANRTRP